jgi:hypothetical protein
MNVLCDPRGKTELMSFPLIAYRVVAWRKQRSIAMQRAKTLHTPARIERALTDPVDSFRRMVPFVGKIKSIHDNK